MADDKQIRAFRKRCSEAAGNWDHEALDDLAIEAHDMGEEKLVKMAKRYQKKLDSEIDDFLDEEYPIEEKS